MQSLRRASLALAASLVLQACGPAQSSPAAPSQPAASPGFVRGVAFSPQGFPNDFSRTEAFFEEVGGMPSGGVLANTAWRDDAAGGADAGKIPALARLTMEQAVAKGFTPVIVFGWRSGDQVLLQVPGGAANVWTNAEAQARFLEMLETFTETYRPPFLFLGNENDFYFEQNPEDYARWLAFYSQAYRAIKAASPATSVGPVFNYEHLVGRGGRVGWTTPRWESLEQHDLRQVDLLGLTVYPWLGYDRPEQVPADYLGDLFSRLGATPLAVTETGWPGEDPLGMAGSIEVSAEAQMRFLAALAAMLEGADVRLVDWLFLYPLRPEPDAPLENALFGGISLRDASGAPRPVYEPWLTFQP